MTFVGIDTNILVDAVGIRRAASDIEKIKASRALLSSFKEGVTVVASTQTWGELFAVLTRSGMARADARATIGDLRTAISSAPVPTQVFDAALVLADTNAFQIWDAIIVKSCEAAGVALLLSEDMQDGLKVGNILIANPLAQKCHPKVSALLRIS